MGKNTENKTVWSSPSWHVCLIYLTLFLVANLVDALQTAIWYHDGIVVETNLLMALALKVSLHFFVITKMSLVTVCGAILVIATKKYRKRLAWIALQLATLGFLLLLIYESIGYYLDAMVR